MMTGVRSRITKRCYMLFTVSASVVAPATSFSPSPSPNSATLLYFDTDSAKSLQVDIHHNVSSSISCCNNQIKCRRHEYRSAVVSVYLPHLRTVCQSQRPILLRNARGLYFVTQYRRKLQDIILTLVQSMQQHVKTTSCVKCQYQFGTILCRNRNKRQTRTDLEAQLTEDQKSMSQKAAEKSRG